MKTLNVKLPTCVSQQWIPIVAFALLVSFCAISSAFEYTPPETIGVKTLQSYILVHGVKSTAGDRENLEHWLKDRELNRMFQDPAVDQTTLYRPDPPDSQIDYLVIVRFDVIQDPSDPKDYEQVAKRISNRLNTLLQHAPPALETTLKLFYREHHRGLRMEPRYAGTFQWPETDSQYTVTWGDAFGPNGIVKPGPVKYADYGFSHSCDPAQQWAYIRWYQEVRQHDVIGPYGAYDTYRMWLLVPGQTDAVPQEDYEYVLTMYEWSPWDFETATCAWGGGGDFCAPGDTAKSFYAYLNYKDTYPGSMAYNYCTGPRGHTTVIKELHKDRSQNANK